MTASRPVVSVVDRTTSNGSTRAGQVPVIRRLTDLIVDGAVVETIIWNGPLLRRLESRGLGRDDYVAERIARIERG
jgi:hypothetical protein